MLEILGASEGLTPDLGNEFAETSTTLLLHALGSHAIHVVDPEGNGIDGLDLGIRMSMGNGESIVLQEFLPARVRTANHGKVAIPWMPSSKPEFVSVGLSSF